MLVVKKFGGTSVADKERIMNVAKRCIADYKAGNDVVVVLSAMGKQTDVLIDMAKDINPNPPRRELDMLMTTGEQISVSLMAIASRLVRQLTLHSLVQVLIPTLESLQLTRLTMLSLRLVRRLEHGQLSSSRPVM